MADRSAAADSHSVVVEPTSATRISRTNQAIAISLAMITLAAYAQVAGHQFISLDDDAYIFENAVVQRGLSTAGIVWAFTTFHSANWHPLTWIAHMIDVELFGLWAGGHLLVNSLIHAANAVLVFRLLSRTTSAIWCSAMVAALFALHPLHVESVAWAAERKDTLSTFFGLLSLHAYVAYAAAPNVRSYLPVAAWLALGLMAKPMLVTWPFIMLLMDYWPLRRIATSDKVGGVSTQRLRLIAEKLPLLLMVAASAVVTFVAQSQGGAVRAVSDASIGFRTSNAAIAYAKYLLLTFWPHDLAVYYPFSGGGVPLLQVASAVVLLVAISVFCFLNRNKHPYLLVGWLWFIGTLVPVIGIVQVGAQAMADRYHYVPSIGLFTALVFGTAAAAQTWRWPGYLRGGIAATSLLLLLPLTLMQIHRWRDSFTLFEHTLRVTPPNLLIEYNYAVVLARSGRLDEAANHFARALEIQPTYYNALVNLGLTRARQGRVAEAVPYFERAIAADPKSPKAYVHLGMAFTHLNRERDAIAALQQAVAIAPADAGARANLGLALVRSGDASEGIKHLQEATRLDPTNPETRTNLGIALLANGRPEESVGEFELALRLNPQLEAAAQNLRRARQELKFRR
jgi:protein O-mannosyl-transferase